MTPRVAFICAALALLVGCGDAGKSTIAATDGPSSGSQSIKPWGATAESKVDLPPDASNAKPDDAKKAPEPPKAAPAEADSNLFKWAMDSDEGLAQAKKAHGYVVLKFEADWCAPCQVMKHEAFQSPEVAKALKKAVIVPVDFDTDAGQELGKKYGTTSLPRLVFVHPNGKAFGVIDGYTSVDWLLRQIDRVMSSDESKG